MTYVPDPSWPTITELGIEVWGPPNEKLRKKDEVRWGENGSKRVTPSKNVWKDEAAGEGGGYVQLWKKARNDAPLPPRTDGLGKTGNGKGKHTGIPPWENIGTTYDYPGTEVDPRLIQVVRTRNGNPRFLQRQPTGDGKWKWNVNDIPDHNRRLYKLAELRAAPKQELVWICAGEKDTDRLFNAALTATTNIGGEGKWRKEYTEEFRDRPCIVLQDNDDTGQRHVADVARSLHGVATSVKVLLLPGLPLKGDVSDFLDAGHTLNELNRLADEAPEYVPPTDNQQFNEAGWHIIRPTEWQDQIPPDRDWLIEELLPIGFASLLFGPGAIGKSLLVQQLLTSTALQLAGWIGHKPRHQLKSAGLFSEDDNNELFRRQRDINTSLRCDFRDLTNVRLISTVGGEPTLFAFDQPGIKGGPTELWAAFAASVIERGERLFTIDSLTTTVLGNLNDPMVAAQVMTAITTLAHKINGVGLAVLHPSRAGMRADSSGSDGDSYSPMWGNRARARLYLGPATEKDDDDSGVRVLKLWKANYALAGKQVRLIWKEGVLWPEALAMPGAAAKAERERNDDDLFLRLLDLANARHECLSTSQKGNYAPRCMKRARPAETRGIPVERLEAAMNRLLDRKVIQQNAPQGRTRRSLWLDRVEEA